MTIAPRFHARDDIHGSKILLDTKFTKMVVKEQSFSAISTVLSAQPPEIKKLSLWGTVFSI
jgi:hypothetical protein